MALVDSRGRPRGNRAGRASPKSAAGVPSSRRLLIAVSFLTLLALAIYLALRPAPLGGVKNLDTPNRAVVCLGDSLTAGVGAVPGEDVPSRLAVGLGRPVVNAGVSGDTVRDALGRIERDVLPHRPGIVVVCLGGNDFLRAGTPDAAAESLIAVISRLQDAGAMVILGGFEFPSLSGDWGKMYRRLAQEHGCLLEPDLLRGIRRDAGLMSDAIHPNGRGYAVVAARLEKPLRRLMAAARWP